MFRHYLPLFLLLFMYLILHACTLEERYHIRKDMSGTYEMTFNFSELVNGNEEDDFELVEGMRGIMDSITMSYDTITGISDVRPLMTDTTMQVSISFDDLFGVEQLLRRGEEEGSRPIFERKGKRFLYTPDVKNSLNAMSTDDGADEESSDDTPTSGGEGKEEDFFRIRTVITFEGKVRPKKMEHFRREGDNTFIYDSAEEGLDVEPILDVKY